MCATNDDGQILPALRFFIAPTPVITYDTAISVMRNTYIRVYTYIYQYY